MATILVTGGTGFIGTEITNALAALNHHVVILTRGKSKSDPNGKIEFSHWDIDKNEFDPLVFAKADHIIHLAGAGVADKRWTAKRKKEIVSSRVKSGELIVHALRSVENSVKSVSSISGIGWYGPDRQEQRPFTENDPPFNDFLAQTCVKWESAINPVTALNKRLVILRTGIVMGEKGGAVKELSKSLKFGVATIPGNGKQIISWIHIEDLVSVFLKSISDEKMSGIYNAVAPDPSPFKEIILNMARSRNGRKFVAVNIPAFALKLVLGEMSIELLKSATVSPARLINEKFQFIKPAVQLAFMR